MYKINISKDSEYHTQINNKLVPLESCNTTAVIMALKASGIDFHAESGMQEEDYATRIMQSEEAHKVMKERAPWAVKQGYPPQQVHTMLQWLINEKLVGKEVSDFSTSYSVEDIVYNVAKIQTASIVSGGFTSYGHMVTVVGVETKQNLDKVTSASQIERDKIKNLIIDDPYGDYHSEYDSEKGNDVKLPMNDFFEICNKKNHWSKWAHVFFRPGVE